MDKFDLGKILGEKAEADPLSVIPKDTPKENLIEALEPILTGMASAPKLTQEAMLLRMEKHFNLNKIEAKAFRSDSNVFLKAEDGEKEKRPTQTDMLIQLAQTAILFRDDLQEPFARIDVNGHSEIWPVKSKYYKRWLVGRYYTDTGKAPSTDAVSQALGVVEAKSSFDGEEYKLSVRVAEHEGSFYYDLADKGWRSIRVNADGWSIVENPPVLFRRYPNMGAQAEPTGPGDISELFRFVNLADQASRDLLAVYIVSSLVPNIPHAIPIFYGGHGAAKSTAACVNRKLVDPGKEDLLTLHHDKNELALCLAKNYMPAFDNLDNLQPWQSDMLCRAATGGGITKRALYTDDEEIILSFRRCPVLNGINLVATRPDLLDRSILFGLERIDAKDRKQETEFWADFEQARPRILAGTFDALAGAMRIYPNVKIPRLPRMADFCTWGYAIAESLGIGGESFLKAYEENISSANEQAIYNSPVASAIIAFMDGRTEWSGTTSTLWNELQTVAEKIRVDVKAKSWPKAANALTRRLNQTKSNLADAGIKFIDGHDSTTNKSLIIFFREGIKNISGTSGTSGVQEVRGFPGRRYPGDIESYTSVNENTSGIPPDGRGNKDAVSGDTGDTGDIFPAFREKSQEKESSGKGVPIPLDEHELKQEALL